MVSKAKLLCPENHLSKREVAAIFNCSLDTITLWAKKYPELGEPVVVKGLHFWEKKNIARFYRNHMKLVGKNHSRMRSEQTFEQKWREQFLERAILNYN